jgi:hypothetical protein
MNEQINSKQKCKRFIIGITQLEKGAHNDNKQLLVPDKKKA